ncbi:UNVERIFIED_ORG: hypothetical protein ABIC48_002559 [Burkholderia territorii]
MVPSRASRDGWVSTVAGIDTFRDAIDLTFRLADRQLALRGHGSGVPAAPRAIRRAVPERSALFGFEQHIGMAEPAEFVGERFDEHDAPGERNWIFYFRDEIPIMVLK